MLTEIPGSKLLCDPLSLQETALSVAPVRPSVRPSGASDFLKIEKS